MISDLIVRSAENKVSPTAGIKFRWVYLRIGYGPGNTLVWQRVATGRFVRRDKLAGEAIAEVPICPMAAHRREVFADELVEPLKVDQANIMSMIYQHYGLGIKDTEPEISLEEAFAPTDDEPKRKGKK